MAAPLRCWNFVNKCKCIPFAFSKRYSSGAILTVSNGNKLESRQFSVCLPLYSKPAVPAAQVKKMMENLTDKFAEARELLDDARESKGTVYFSEDMEEAQQAVSDTLEEYRNMLDSLSSEQKKEVISTLGLRMEELKAQQAAMEDDH